MTIGKRIILTASFLCLVIAAIVATHYRMAYQNADGAMWVRRSDSK